MLKINLSNINNIVPKARIISNKFKTLLHSQLDQDIFVKSKKDLLQSSREEIFKAIDTSIKDENLIGEGSEAKVYKIQSSEYVVRLIKNENTDGFVDYKNSLSFLISSRDKINHVVAKLGEGCSIMEYLPGENLCKCKCPRELAGLSKSVYYDLYKKICYAKANGMVFDVSPSNIIYDSDKKTLTPIDFIRKKRFTEETLPLSDIFLSFSFYLLLPQQSLNKIFNILLKIAKSEINSKHPIHKISKKDMTEFFRLYKTYCATELFQSIDKIEKEILGKYK